MPFGSRSSQSLPQAESSKMTKDSDMICVIFFIFNELCLLSHGGLKPTAFAKLTHASGNGAAIGGLKVTTENGWFAARPSGTENIYKIYSESFLGEEHIAQIQTEAQQIVAQAFTKAGI